MVTRRLLEDAWTVLDSAPLGVGGAVVDAAQAREGDCLGAHRTGLQGDVQVAIDQPWRAYFCRRRADSQQFGMCRRIAIGLGAIAGFGENLAIRTDHHTADWNLAPLCGFARPSERALHGRKSCRGSHKGENSARRF